MRCNKVSGLASQKCNEFVIRSAGAFKRDAGHGRLKMDDQKMEELKIELEKTASGVGIFRLAGPLTIKTMFGFQDRARAEAQSPIVVDLSGVPYMDSAGLGAILGLLASCHRHSRGFGISGANDRIRTLFAVARVDGMIPSYDSVESAVSRLSKSASA